MLETKYCFTKRVALERLLSAKISQHRTMTLILPPETPKLFSRPNLENLLQLETPISSKDPGKTSDCNRMKLERFRKKMSFTLIEQFIWGITRYCDGWRRVRASERVSAHQNIT